MQPMIQPSSSRILYDVPCAVCRDHSSGKHYGVFACDGCAGFFKRSVRRDRKYACKARIAGACIIDKAHRNQCRACRLAKCLEVGMNRDAVQHERGPRNSTIRRQMAMFFEPRRVAYAVDSTPPSNNQFMPRTPETVCPHSYPALQQIGQPVMRAPLPPSPPNSLGYDRDDPNATCEVAARLLFINVRWVKNSAGFDSLSFQDRLILLEESWRELFLIGCAEYLYPMNLRIFLNLNTQIKLWDLHAFEMALAEAVEIRADENELTYLRSVALFRTCFNERRQGNKFQDLPTIALLQDQAQNMLTEYCARNRRDDPTRATRLLQLIRVFGTVPRELIVELFFKATIGAIPIERIIGDMYRCSKQND